MPASNSILLPAVLGSSAVMLGAMGAHALKPLLTIDQLQSFETAVRYQLIHSLGLFFIALLKPETLHSLRWTQRFWQFGIFLFSGSIYLLLLLKTLLPQLNYTWLGLLTPLGGLCLIAGWLSAVKLKNS